MRSASDDPPGGRAAESPLFVLLAPVDISGRTAAHDSGSLPRRPAEPFLIVSWGMDRESHEIPPFVESIEASHNPLLLVGRLSKEFRGA